MANLARNSSAPMLLNLDADTYVIVGLNTPTDDEDDESEGDGAFNDNVIINFNNDDNNVMNNDDEDDDYPLSHSQGGESAFFTLSSDSEMLSPFDASPRSRNNTMPSFRDEILTRGGLLPDRYFSHSHELLSSEPDSSPCSPRVQPRLAKKTRPAPLPPDMSPASSLRHSYAMGSLGSSEFSHLRTSTDTESITSESRYHAYHTSTDSDTMLPESARGSNFPGELAGVDNLHQGRIISPRTAHSKFRLLRDKLGKSPQVGRRKSKKDKDKDKEEKHSPRLRKSRKDEGIKSPRLRKNATVDSLQLELSDVVFALAYDLLEANEEFEIKRVPDFDRFLGELISETDPSHPDYEDLTKAAKRVHSMVREREDDLYQPDNQAMLDGIQERFPLDDLHLTDTIDDRSANNNNHLNMNNNNSSSSNNNNTGNDVTDDTDKGSSTKSKSISVRRRSAPSAVIFKSITGSRSRSTNSLWSNAGGSMGKKDHDSLHATAFRLVDSDSNRMFLMEGPVQLATGMQTQERYLFLFSDLLLVAKQKSSSSFKLKTRVQLCDMWIASCIDEVCETTRPHERSFVIGWPTTNVVTSFPDVDTKQRWLQALSESITQEKVKEEQRSIPLKVDTKDIDTAEKACQMSINNVTTAKDVLTQCLNQLGLSENESADYHLWVLSGKEGSAYPLIGHETPFSIKLSQERELTRSKSRDDIDNMTSGDLDSVDDRRGGNQKCEFYLKQKKSPKKHQLDNSSYQKSMKKSKKSTGLFNQILRKIRQPQSQVFGRPLTDICDDNLDPPESIMKLMTLVYRVGPSISGIMRRGNNASLGKDVREKIDTEVRYSLEDHQVPTAASVFKEFLRCIPGGLLTLNLRDQWADINMDDRENVKVERIKGILKQLPAHNYRLLMYTISILQHLSKHSDVTNMGPGNLSTCIAPSLCASQPGQELTGKYPTNNSPESLKQVQDSMMEITNVYTPLITFMIIKHREIFGDEVLNMFVKFDCIPSPPVSLEEGGPQDPESESVHTNTEDETEEDMEEDEDEEEEEDEEISSFNQQVQKRYRNHRHPRQLQQHSQRNSNSGTDSDSTHSVLSMTDTGVRRDDSSVDSLVDREYYPTENDSSPKPIKSHLSPSNLSRDSGLTLSDTQLYDEDGDMAMIVGNKMYGRGSSNLEEIEGSDSLMFSRSLDPKRDRRSVPNPVPPPRVKAPKKPRGNSEGAKGEQFNLTSPSQHMPHPFKHSASTPQLDIYNLRAGRDHPSGGAIHAPLGKRISSDSIGEEVEPVEQLPLVPDLKRLQQIQDIGTIVKTDSGTHLYLRDSESIQKRDQRFMRQISATDSTPPVSPQSHLSQSSRDSLLSDSTHSVSRDSLFHSAPQTPDSPTDKPPTWVPQTDKAFRPWNERLGRSLNAEYENRLSKSTSDILQQDNEDNEDNEEFRPHFDVLSESSPNSMQRPDTWSEDHIQRYKPSSPKFYMGKSHEAEEIDTSRHFHFSLMSRQESNLEDEVKSVMSERNRNSANDMQHSDRFHQLLQGSPPPNVLLQNLQAVPQRRESTPMRASYDEAIVAQLRRSSTDTVNSPPVDSSKTMSTIRPEEYQRGTPKPIMIPQLHPMEDQTVSGRIKSSKYTVPNTEGSPKNKDISGDSSKRPDKPPCYQQALQRNFMIKQKVPVDVSMTKSGGHQKESCSHARAMYEKSLRMYDEQRKVSSSESRKSSAKSVSSSESKDVHSNFPQAEKSKLSPVISSTVNNNNNNFFGESSQYGASKDLSSSPHRFDDSGASGFLDLGPISHSLQEDVVTQRNSHRGSNTGSLSASSSISIHRTDSKLSDTGSSSGGSSVTLSTLSHHSDSFCHRSDISNVTVSSVTSSDSNSDSSIMSSRRWSGSGFENYNNAYSRHFRPVEPDNSVKSNSRKQSSDDEDDEDRHEDVYVTLKKDPKQIYMESKMLFEQNEVPSLSHPATRASNKKSLSSSSSSTSSASSSHSLTPRSSIDMSSAIIDPPQGHIPKFQNPLAKNDVSTANMGSLSSLSQSTNSNLGPSLRRRAQKTQSSHFLRSSLPSRPKTYHECQGKLEVKESKSEPFSDGLPTDHHANFMKARSLFYSPEDDRIASPILSSRSSQPAKSVAPSTQISEENPPQTEVSQATSHKGNDINTIPSGDGKNELPWSVRDLKSLFDNRRDRTHSSSESATKKNYNNSRNGSKTNQAGMSSSEPSSSSTVTSANRPRSPPSYLNPPPFKRSQNNSRASTSSTSSAGSEGSASRFPSSARVASQSHRYGPQCNGLDGYASCSSSEEGYNSSLDRNIRRPSLQELDALADHTHITYV